MSAVTAERIVALARSWLGTPYHHQASLKGVGCDCLGLVRGIYAEAYGRPAEEPPAYSRDLAEATGIETLLEAARGHLVEVQRYREEDIAEPGAVLVFRLRPTAMAKHCGIVTSPGTMMHAFEGATVCEIGLSSWWRRRIAAVFRFPEEPR